MLGDGHCDEVCDTAGCDRDGHDCECAPGCGFHDLVNCKAECMVPECGYGRLPGHASCSEFQSTAALYHAIILYREYNHWNIPVFSGCNSCPLEESFTRCLNDDSCMSLECNSNFGLCNSSLECEAMSPEGICFKCKEEFVNNYGQCEHECSSGLGLFPLLGNQCLPAYDDSTPEHPDVFYVNDSGEYADFGQRLSFTSLSDAFMAMKKKHTRILLSGQNFLSVPEESLFLKRSNWKPFATFSDRTFNITLTAACADCRATVRLDQPQFDFTSVSFGRLYCSSRITGFLKIERVNFVMDYTPQWAAYQLFLIGAWKVVFSHVAFRGINGYFWLISMTASGDLTMINVDFEDIAVSYVVERSFGECSEQFPIPGTMIYANGTVSAVRATNFFVLNRLKTTSVSRVVVQFVEVTDFLSVTEAGELILSDCRFHYNKFTTILHVYPNNDPLASSYTPFWHFGDSEREDILITNSEFRGNEGQYCLRFEFGYFPRNVRVASCDFRNDRETILSVGKYTPVQKSDIYGIVRYFNNVRVTADPIFTDLRNLTLQNCTAPLDFFSVTNFSRVSASDISVTESWSDKCQTIFVFSKCFNVSVTRVTISDIHCNLGLLFLNASSVTGGLSITSTHITQSSGEDLMSASAIDAVTLSNFTVIHFAAAHLINLTDSEKVSMHSCRFENNEASAGMLLCSAKLCLVAETRLVLNRVGSGGAVQLQTSKSQITVQVLENLLFYRNQAESPGAIVLVQSAQASQQSQLALRHLNFTYNTAGTAIVLTSDSTVLAGGSEIIDCHFLHNSAAESIIKMHFEQGALYISQSQFRENKGDAVSFAHSSIYVSSELHITSTDFIGSTRSAVYIRKSLSQSIFSVSSSVFANCLSGSMVVQNAQSTLWNCTFQNNTADAGGALSLEQGSVVRGNSCQFALNSAAGKGGAVWVAEGSQLICSHCTFAGNSAAAAGGAIYISPDASVSLSRSLFEENSAVEGSAMYSLMSTAFVADNCTFRHNRAEQKATIEVFFLALTLRNCIVQENYCGQLTPGIVLSLSNLTIESSTFTSHSGFSGTLLHATMRSVVNISSSQFSNIKSGNGAIYVDDTVIDISHSAFQSMSADFGSVIVGIRYSTLFFSDNSVESQFNKKGGVLYILQSTCSVKDSRFSAFDTSAIYSKGANVDFQNSTFNSNFHLGINALEGGGLYCEDCEKVEIFECKFIGLNAKSGAGLFLSGTTVDRFSIKSSIFQGNTASESAGIHADVAALEIKQCAFINNKAESRGGALTLLCTGACFQSVQSSRFVMNKAGSHGGAICWQKGSATFIDNAFEANTALYGPSVSSFPVSLFLVTKSFPAVASGQPFPSQLILEARDHYNQTVLIDNFTTAELSASNAEIYGGVKTTASRGKLVFSSFSIVGQLNTTIRISSTELQSTLEVDIYFRNCVIGEFRAKNRCIICGPGTYSLDPSQPCTECDKHADCPGTYLLIPRPGYWRPTNHSTQLMQCPNQDACLGPPDPTGTCAKGYTGNMCQTCAVEYVRYAKTYCQPCPSQLSALLMTVGMAVGAVLFSTILVISTIKSAYKEKSQMSLSLKVLMNYLQLVMFMGAFNLSWPDLTKRLLNIQNSAGGFSEQILAPGCLRSNYDENEDFYWKVAAMAFLPLIVVSLSSVLWALWALCRRQASILRNELVGSATILFFLVNPNVIRVMFSALNCEKIDGEYWIVGLKQQCWQGDHWKYAVATALPALLLWGVAVPALVLLLMSRQRNRLRELQVRVRFGFLFNGYNAEQFYWEFIVIYRKLVIVSLAVFLSRFAQVIPALSTLVVLALSLSLQEVHKPFRLAAFNTLEKRSLLVSTVTLFCGLYFLFGGLSSLAETAFFAVIVGVNVHFLQYWVRTTFKAWAAKVVARLPCLQQFFVVLGEDRVVTYKRFQAIRELAQRIRLPLASPRKKLYFEKIYRQEA